MIKPQNFQHYKTYFQFIQYILDFIHDLFFKRSFAKTKST